MGSNVVLFVVAASLLMASASATYDLKKITEQVFHVGGKVLCQDCTGDYKQWVQGAKPIKGCRVSVTCLDERSRVVHYVSDATDEAGDFEMAINKIVNGKPIKSENCFLRLISSPDPVCNLATDFAGGKSGLKLGRPNIKYRNLVKHMMGPFYYTTPMCDEPDTTGDDEAKDNNY